MQFNEMYELFGKSSMITAISVVLSLLLAISSVTPDSITMKTFIVFFTRVTMFGVNSYVGFIVSKAAVEKIKLNILVNIHNFLQKFIEANDTEVGVEE